MPKETKIDKTNLGYLGREYQYGLIKCLMDEPRFLSSIYPIISTNQNCFTDVYLRETVGVILELYKKLGYEPSWEHLRIKLRSRANDEDKLQYIDETLDAIKNSKLPVVAVKDHVYTFFKQQEATKLLNLLKEAVIDGIDDKKMDKVYKAVDTLRTVGEPNEQVTTYNDETLTNALMRKHENKEVPTGIPEVDDMLGGGSRRGEVSLFMAFTGAGKSTWCRCIGFNMAMAGYKVIYLYFEESVQDIEDQGVAQLTGLYPSQVGGLSQENAEEFVRKLNEEDKKRLLEANYKPIRGKNKSTTVEDIERIINEQRLRFDFKCDVLLVDYFSCLKHSSSPVKDVWHAQEDCMRKLDEIAFKFGITIWVTQQTNRQGVQMDEESGIGNVQGSFNATNVCANIVQLLRTEDQQLNNRATLKFWKTRHARKPNNTLEDILYDNGHSIIRCDCVKESLLYDEAEQDRYERGQFQLIDKRPNEQD